MSRSAIKVSDSEICIRAEYFNTKDNSCINKEWLQDILSNHYCGQQIIITALDGENIRASGFLSLVTELSLVLDIPLESIIVETHDTGLVSPLKVKHLPLGLFLGANKYIPKFNRLLNDTPKFIGTVIGRFTPLRLRLAYELDCAFNNDTFIIFQGRPWSNAEPFKELYQKEMGWFTNKQFNYDINTASPTGAVGFDEAYHNYPNIWDKYQIEAVIETDPISDFWFTEKTAKCLATGKPFVLVNGFQSLNKLREMGFFTYGSVIDESYDNEPIPTLRINAIVNSLRLLYNDTDKIEKINQLYRIAEKNIAVYQQYVKDQGHDV